MKLDLNALTVESFTVETGSVSEPVPATGPEGPYSLCWICRDTDPGVPGCDYQEPTPPKPYPYDPLNPLRSRIVDSVCMCYA